MDVLSYVSPRLVNLTHVDVGSGLHLVKINGRVIPVRPITFLLVNNQFNSIFYCENQRRLTPVGTILNGYI